MEALAARDRTFGEEHFGHAQLGDRRRTCRLVRLADTFVAHPGGTLPDKCGDPAMYQGLLGLLDCEAVTHSSVLQPHLEHTWRLIAQRDDPVVLFLFDITELDFTSRTSLADQLGSIGDGNGTGYQCLNGLAVLPQSREVLGLVYQELFRRAAAPSQQTKAQSRARATRQSRLWVRGPQAVKAAPPQRRYVCVFDAEGETTEALAALQRDAKEYVTLSQSDRRIRQGHSAEAAEGKLYAFARALPEQARRVVELSVRPGRPARQARCAVAWADVQIIPPRQPRGEHGREPLPVWVVRVWEKDPPAGAEGLEWMLLTNAAVRSREDALERATWYESRWVLEEYHKGQKTGCGIENPQLRSRARLEPLLALLSVVAVHLLRLRDAGRRADAPSQPATDLFARVYVEVLSLKRYGERRDLTVHEFLYALARLGGHQNRKGDGPPGWLVLWRGWMKLQLMAEVAVLLKDEKM